jgi:hypothetical protein
MVNEFVCKSYKNKIQEREIRLKIRISVDEKNKIVYNIL